MANGIKRAAAEAPQSRSKKTKTPANASRVSLAADAASSPSKGEASQDVNDSQIQGDVDNTIGVLKNFKIKHDDWPKRFGKELDENQEKLLERLSTTKQAIVDEMQKFAQTLLPILREALSPIDDQESPQVQRDSILDVHFGTAGQQDYVQHLTNLLAASHSLVQTYQKAREKDKETPPSRLDDLDASARKDKRHALAMIDAGRNVAARDIEHMLADRNNEVRGRGRISKQEELQGGTLLLQGKEEDEDEDKENQVVRGWGIVAEEAAKAVQKLDRVRR